MKENFKPQLNNNQSLPEHLEAAPKQQTLTTAAKQGAVFITVVAGSVFIGSFAGKFTATIANNLIDHGYKFTVGFSRNGFVFTACPTKYFLPVAA